MKEEWAKNILRIIVIVLVLLILYNLYTASIPEKSNGIKWDKKAVVSHEISYIAIPGFSKIIFNHDTKEQSFKFHNPDTNNCYMDISLIVDNEVVFDMKRIEPGYGIKEIKLNKTLSSGLYTDCTFSVKCFSMSNNTQLNGIQNKIDIYVR